jgi:glycosyltransferase
MKVSLITATYNSESTLLDTLISLKNQDYKNIEYIIVDGASTDNTLDLVRAHYCQVSVVISEPDKGIYDALNKGLKAATGDIVGFLHSDDILADENVISNVVKIFQNDKCDAVYGDLEYVSRSDLNNKIRVWRSGVFKKYKMHLGWMPPHPTFYMKRKCYSELGLFSLDYKISADYESLIRYIQSERLKLSYLPSVLTKMRVGGISNRSLKSMFKKSFEDIKAMKKHRIFWPLAIIFKNLSKIPQFIRK